LVGLAFGQEFPFGLKRKRGKRCTRPLLVNQPPTPHVFSLFLGKLWSSLAFSAQSRPLVTGTSGRWSATGGQVLRIRHRRVRLSIGERDWLMPDHGLVYSWHPLAFGALHKQAWQALLLLLSSFILQHIDRKKAGFRAGRRRKGHGLARCFSTFSVPDDVLFGAGVFFFLLFSICFCLLARRGAREGAGVMIESWIKKELGC